MKVFLTVSALLAFGVGVWRSGAGDWQALTACTVVFLALLVCANLDRLSRFKASASGLEGETRELISRAEVTLSQLQVLAKHVGSVSLSLVKRQGRMGGFTDAEEESVRSKVIEALRKSGLSDADLDEALRDWHRITEHDYAYFILGAHRAPDPSDDQALRPAWDQLRRGGFDATASPADVRAFLERFELLTPELAERLQDYESYQANRRHRRPEVWAARNNWGQLRKSTAS